MVPYIALLIVLIVAILFSVYKGADGFFVSEVNWTKDTPLKDMITFYEQSVDEAVKVKDKIASAPPFDDGVTQEKLEELGLPFVWTRDNGLEYDKPLSSLLAKAIEEDRKAIAGMLDSLQKGIQQGKLKETMTLQEAMAVDGKGDPNDMSGINAFVNMMVKLRNKRKAFIDEKLGVSMRDVKTEGYPELTCPGGKPPFSRNGKVMCRDLLGNVSSTPLTCPVGTVPYFVFEPSAKVFCVPPTLPYEMNPQASSSGGTITACKAGDMVGLSATDNSQKCLPKYTKPTVAATTAAATTAAATTARKSAEVAGVSAEDLFKAVGGVQQALKASKPAEIEKEQAAAPEQTLASTKEMEERIAKSVATQLKDSMLAQRATKNVAEDVACPYASYQSDAVAQGTEYTQARPHPGPDMSEYIRKDSIPCWNCSLP